jgi:exosortase E/protease (VPEID-CTERM system)
MLLGPIRTAVARANTPQSRRWIGLVVLLAAEATLLSIRFDTGTVSQGHGGWGHLIARYFRFVPQVGLVAVLACILMCWVWLRDELRRELSVTRARSIVAPVVAHLALCSLFTGLTWKVLEGEIDAGPMPLAWVAGWAAAGLAMLATWCWAVLPPRFWGIVVRKGAPMIVLGLTYAVVAVFVARYSGKSWRFLAEPTLWASSQLLNFIYSDVVCNRATFELGTTRFHVSIAAACAGYQGIGLTLMTVGFFLVAWRPRLRFPQALLLLPIGVVAMGTSNIIRITAMIALGTSISPQVALGGFHSQVGWLMFIVVMVCLVLMADRLRFFSKAPVAAIETPPETGNLRYRIGNAEPAMARASMENRPLPLAEQPTVVFLAPLVTLVGTTIITTALSSGFDWGYPLRVVTTGLVLWLFRHQYRRMSWSISPVAVLAGIGTFVLWLMLEPGPATDDAGRLPESMPHVWRNIWIASKLIGSIVTVPIVEELAFRGYLPRRLLAFEFERLPLNRFDLPSFLVSSLAFGLLHGRWVAGTLAGMIFYLTMMHRGRLSDAVVAHAVTNALIAAAVLTTGSWYLWS